MVTRDEEGCFWFWLLFFAIIRINCCAFYGTVCPPPYTVFKFGERGSGLSSFEEQIEPREFDLLPTKEMFFNGIFLVMVLGGDLDPSSEGDDLLVAKKLRFYIGKVGYI